MKTLKKEAIQEIAKLHGVKSSELAIFVNRVQNLKKDDVESELLKFKSQAGVVKALYKAAVDAVSEMFDGEPTKAEKKAEKSLKEKDAEQSERIKKDKKNKNKDKKEDKEEKPKEKKETSDSAFKANTYTPTN